MKKYLNFYLERYLLLLLIQYLNIIDIKLLATIFSAPNECLPQGFQHRFVYNSDTFFKEFSLLDKISLK